MSIIDRHAAGARTPIHAIATFSWIPIGLRVGAALVVAVASGAAEAAATARASAVHLEETAQGSALVFDLSAPVEVKAFVLANPDRIIVDLPEVDFELATGAKPAAPSRPKDPSKNVPKGSARPPATGESAALIQSYRFGLFAAGRSRIVVDLGAPARVVRATTEANGTGYRLVLELARTDRVTFRAAAISAAARQAQPAAAEAARPGAAAPEKGARPVIVLDPGHGGIDSGARSAAGVIEKDVVFDFARALAAQLEADGRYKVIITRRDDTFVALSERVKVAREANAALFVSIHADTLAESADVGGATIYTASEKASDAEAARVAEKENQSDQIAGLEGRDDIGEVSDILFDLTRRETRAYSHLFARSLGSLWKTAGRLNKNPQRAAGFRVLRAPDVPSILLELGYLSNNRDVADLVAPAWRDKAAATIVRAIDGFFGVRTARRAADQAGLDFGAVGTIGAPSSTGAIVSQAKQDRGDR